MTIATTVSSVTIQGNGATTLFNYSFLIPEDTDVVVTVTDTTVSPTTTTTIPSSQYGITGVGNSSGGTVQYPTSGTPLAAGQYITIQRVLAFLQTTQISNQGNFYPEVVEAALDYQMMCLQQLSTQLAAASFPSTFVSLTGQTPISVSQSGGQYVISLNPITSASISAGAVTTAKLADGAATLAKLDRTGTSASVLTAQGAGNAPIWAALSTTTQAPPVRQTVLAAAVDSSGLANFISIGTGLSVNIAATSVNIILTAANGFSAAGATDRIGSISADTTISGLTASNTNYLYADIASNGAVTLGKTILAPVYQVGGTYSTTNGQYTFNTQQMIGKVGNGSTADQTYRVFIGEAVTNGTNVTSVVNYALMGRYYSPFTNTLPGASTATAFSHNIGTNLITGMPILVIECTVTDNGYAVGDRVMLPAGFSSTGGDQVFNYVLTSRNTIQFSTPNTSGFRIMPKSGGLSVALTQADWKYAMIVPRGW